MDFDATRRLLADVFPDSPKFSDPRFVTWEYEQSPSGRVISAEEHDTEGLVAHYAVLPQRWQVGGESQSWALSLNTAVAERGRGRGLFSALAERTYAEATHQGVVGIVGVANANSTPAFVGRLGFDNHGPLPTRVLVPHSLRSLRRVEKVAPEDIVDLLETPDGRFGARRVWDLPELRWRLADPTQHFHVLRGPGGAVVTCATRQFGVPVVVLAKFFPEPSSGPLEPGLLVAAACRVHRAPSAVHAGHQPDVRLRGMPIPTRLRPSPLTLVMRRLGNDPSPMPRVFEFLDFDAY